MNGSAGGRHRRLALFGEALVEDRAPRRRRRRPHDGLRAVRRPRRASSRRAVASRAPDAFVCTRTNAHSPRSSSDASDSLNSSASSVSSAIFSDDTAMSTAAQSPGSPSGGPAPPASSSSSPEHTLRIECEHETAPRVPPDQRRRAHPTTRSHRPAQRVERARPRAIRRFREARAPPGGASPSTR